ncbi:aminopeptidase N-like [Scaptodrosophila lebanonensis]|uniref:Aminopeptidase n=1 Tax=Drosophila lebanonensis TaxID=7225 RepID=A0A6J2TGP4_DROLE|nr:aminopeptidase N-like [Scaptodrosophila lebanonensis]
MRIQFIVLFSALITVFCYDHYRLPHSVQPLHYTLRVLTHLEDARRLSFTGDVQIKLRVLQETTNITLHASSMLKIADNHTRLQHCSGSGDKKGFIGIKNVERYKKHDYYIIHLVKPLQAAFYVIKLQFWAPLNRNLFGYYVSSYKDMETNETSYISVTQFEPADARCAFPCFDEPHFKATFDIILGHPSDFNALSNMPLTEKIPICGRPNWYWSKFQQTVPMSTYLVAYSINNFEGYTASSSKISHPVQFTTWARSQALEQCHYAAEIAPRLLSYYEEIFDMPYPLPKMDLLAVPDFSAGAMENWGLITFREAALFYARADSSLEDKQRVANIIAHELAHQWFGNLVTMEWWNDLWLNEGFATYVATLGMQRLCKKWHAYEEESLDNVLAIFATDAFYCTRPISQAVGSASTIGNLFDPITYRKGSVIIRMMHNFIGDEAFRRGLKTYLQHHAYGNANQRDLWQALTQAAHQCHRIPAKLSVGTIMDTWTLQSGYPLVTVERDYIHNAANVSQRRFVIHGPARLHEPFSEPFERKAGDYTTPKAWLRCNNAGRAVPLRLYKLPEEDEWLLFNLQLTTPYRVNYDACNWDLITKSLYSKEFRRIHVMNRAQLIDDALALAWSGHMDYKQALELLRYLQHENEFMPWRAALDQLIAIYRIMRQTSDFDVFQKFMQHLLEPIYCHLKGINDDESVKHVPHKTLIAQWACRMAQENCLQVAMDYYQRWYTSDSPDKSNPTPKNLRSVIYCTAMHQGDADDWNFLWQRYLSATVASERRLILQSLGCTRQLWLLQRYMKLIFEPPSLIRKHDAVLAFGGVVRSDVGSQFARDYLFSNFAMLRKFFEPNIRELAGLVIQIAQHMSTSRDYQVLQDFFNKHRDLFNRVPRSAQRAKEQVQLNLRWRQQLMPEFLRYLHTRCYE